MRLAKKRLMNELTMFRAAREEEYPFATVASDPSNEFVLNVKLECPDDSPFAKKFIDFVFEFPPTYPTDPPKITAKQNVYHVNFGQTDKQFMIATLHGKNWHDKHSLGSLFVFIREALTNPSPECAADESVKSLFEKNRAEYDKQVLASAGALPAR